MGRRTPPPPVVGVKVWHPSRPVIRYDCGYGHMHLSYDSATKCDSRTPVKEVSR